MTILVVGAACALGGAVAGAFAMALAVAGRDATGTPNRE